MEISRFLRTALRPIVACLAGLGVLLGGVAFGHEIRPASLQITEHGPGRYDVVWKQPTVGDLAIHLVPHLSSGALDKPPTSQFAEPGMLVKRWQVASGGALDGQTVVIEGLSMSVTDVLVRVTTPSGLEINEVIRPANPSLILKLSAPTGISVPAYLKLGVEHILTGFDHLLFVLGLLLIVGPNWRIVKAVSAFTVAHSLTLALAALGFIHFPSALIESLVALSIVFVAYELVPRPGAQDTLTRRHPWAIAFIFGLLHGLAFAGALADIGLPPKAAPQALFLFNVGVEIGQLTFIAVAVSVMLGLRKIRHLLPKGFEAWSRYAPGYAIGALAAMWFIERTLTVYS